MGTAALTSNLLINQSGEQDVLRPSCVAAPLVMIVVGKTAMHRELPSWRPSTEPLVREDMGRPALIVHFWAPWNAYDRVFDRSMKVLCQEFRANAHFASLNVDDPVMPDVIEQAHLLNVPALVFFRSGRHIETVIGNRKVEFLREVIRRWLA
jgi:thioredoxin 1